MNYKSGRGSKVAGRSKVVRPNFFFLNRVPSTFHLLSSTFKGYGKITSGVFVFAAAIPFNAYACAVCFGNKDSLQTKGTMAGVLFLLVLITGVLISLAVTFIRWGARERALHIAKFGPPSSEPGHS